MPVRPEPVEGFVHKTLRRAQGERGIAGKRTVLRLDPVVPYVAMCGKGRVADRGRRWVTWLHVHGDECKMGDLTPKFPDP